jgi:hypothetical protein
MIQWDGWEEWYGVDLVTQDMAWSVFVAAKICYAYQYRGYEYHKKGDIHF